MKVYTYSEARQKFSMVLDISTITVSELNYGASKSQLQKQNFKRLEEFLAPFEIIPYDQDASQCYCEIRCPNVSLYLSS